MANMKLTGSNIKLNRHYLFFIILFVIAIYVILPQLKVFHSSWDLLLHPNYNWILVGLLFTAATYLTGALTYCLLAFKKLNYWITVTVQLAAMFINRILPGGIGALGVNFLYLRKMKHTVAQSTSVLAINNILGLIGHLLLVIILLRFSTSDQALPRDREISKSAIAITLIVLALVVSAGIFIRRGKIFKFLIDLRDNILSYKRRPINLIAALGSSLILTLSNVICLFCCAQALNVHLPFVALLIIFSFGLGTSTAIPTPGGLGGFEAGLTGGLVAYHIPSSLALSVALLYRLVSYWIPLIVGAIAFIVVEKRRLLTSESG
ncbi:MAG TPA: YbhN family protein [Candidatus Saccharimonadales bacterium]|nr:YbhN family protein [Candidatus Saccharimonadales bacterium]